MNWLDDNRVLLALAAGLYLMLCARIAQHARRLGRPFGKWFLLAFVTAGVAPAIMFVKASRLSRRARGSATASAPEAWHGHPAHASQERPAPAESSSLTGGHGRDARDTHGRDGHATLRCRHCGARFGRDELDRTSGSAACPRCHMTLDDEANYA